MKPHLPFYAPKKYWDLYDREALTLPENLTWQEDIPLSEWHIRKAQESRSLHSGGMDEWSEAYYRRLHHGYYACVSYIDSLVGRLLDELERLELAEDTIVILWGDHGFQLGERSLTGKHNTFDLSLRVPVILRFRDRKVRPVRSEALFSSIDIFPTLVELAGWRNQIIYRALALPVLRRIRRRHFATVSIAASSGPTLFLRNVTPIPVSMRAARCSSTIRRIWTRKKTSPATPNIRMRCSKCGSCWMRASTSP
jgi:arylsulfatase A-like enzyme